MKIAVFIVFIGTVFLFPSCDRMLLPSGTENKPVQNFDDLWANFDQMYGGFEVKGIDWDSVYSVYRPTINENSSEEQLYKALTGLLGVLDDNHVTLKPTNSPLAPYQSGILGRLKTFSDFKEATVEKHYLIERKTIGKTIVYGRLPDNLGYIHLGNMSESRKFYQDALKEIFAYLKDTKGLVLDIRNNKGGMDKNAVFVAGHFISEEKTAFKFRLRNGPGHNDFTPFTDYRVKPEGDSQYLRPIVLATNRFSISAAETFALTMALSKDVTIVGDTTSGAFSDVIPRELPNGWIYRVSIGDWRDAAGKSYEGKGFPPTIVIKNDSTDVANGKDDVLIKAMAILK